MNRRAVRQKPQENLSRDAAIAIMRAADATRRAMVRALQPFDLTLPQFNVLIILRWEEELPILEVAARLVEETPGITRLINTLTAKRYIRRRQCQDDRRQQLCSLTEEGRRLITEVIPHIKTAQGRLISGLSKEKAGQMIALLRAIA